MSTKLGTRRHSPPTPKICVSPKLPPVVWLPGPCYFLALSALVRFKDTGPLPTYIWWQHRLQRGGSPCEWHWQNPGYDQLLWLRVFTDVSTMTIRATVAVLNQGLHPGGWTAQIPIPRKYPVKIRLEPWLGLFSYQSIWCYIAPWMYLLQ